MGIQPKGVLMAIENDDRQGWDFKEKLVDLGHEIIETIKDANRVELDP